MLVGLISCTDDDNNKNDQSSDSMILPKKISYTDSPESTDTYDIIITYDGNKILKTESTTEDIVTEYSYTGNLITKVVTTDGNNNVSTNTKTYTSDNKLSSETTTYYNPSEEPNDTKYTSNYTHNSDGTIFIENLIYNLNDNPVTKDINELLTVSNGKIIERNYGGNMLKYEYDNKNSIFKNVLGFDKLYISSNIDDIIGYYLNLNNSTTNNITKHTTPLYIHTYNYIYNEKGFPIEITIHDDQGYFRGAYKITYY